MAYNEQDDTGLDYGEQELQNLNNSFQNARKLHNHLSNFNPPNKYAEPFESAPNSDANNFGSDYSPESINDDIPSDSDNDIDDSNLSDQENAPEQNNGDAESTASDAEAAEMAEGSSTSQEAGTASAEAGAEAGSEAAGAQASASAGAEAAASTGGEAAATLAAPVILIVMAIILAVLLFIGIIVSVFTALTPSSLNSIKSQQFIEEKNEEVAEKNALTDLIPKTTSWFKNLFAGFSDSGENEETIGANAVNSYTSGDFNPQDEYNDALKANYTVIESALKKSYSLAIKEAKSYCKDNNLSWRRSKSTLKGSSSNSWEAVYADSNYGDLLSAANILLEERSDKSLTDLEYERFTSEEFEEFLLDEEHLKHLYHISYDVVEEKNEEESTLISGLFRYANITIEAYDWYDLFAMSGKTPNDKWDRGIDNYNLAMSRTKQIEIISNEENYALYQLDKQTPFSVDRKDTTAWEITEDSSSGGIIDVSGDNPRIMWEYLKNAGYSDIAAAGVMGNIATESGFKTTWRGDGSSVGFAQWTGKDSNPATRRGGLIAHAESLGLDKEDPHAQASYVIKELSSGQMSKKNLERLKTTTDIQTAADLVCIYYERPQNYSVQDYNNGLCQYDKSRYAYSSISGKYHLDLPKRRNNAVYYYELFAGE